MSFKLGNDDEEILSEINMTPLIDIMLVLLIIFMVTSSVSLESGLDIDLPDSTSKGEAAPNAAIVISLQSEENIMIQGQKVTLETVQTVLENIIKESGSQLVILEGDQASKLGLAVTVMDLAKAAGAKRFAIATETK